MSPFPASFPRLFQSGTTETPHQPSLEHSITPTQPHLHQARSHAQSKTLHSARMQRAGRHPGVWWPWAQCIPRALHPAKSPRSTRSSILSWQSHPLNLLYIGNNNNKNLCSEERIWFRVLEENEVDSWECQTAFLAKLCSLHGLVCSWELLLPSQAAPALRSLEYEQCNVTGLWGQPLGAEQEAAHIPTAPREQIPQAKQHCVLGCASLSVFLFPENILCSI